MNAPPTRRVRAALSVVVPAIAVATLAGACGSSGGGSAAAGPAKAAAPVFDNQAYAAVTCMKHQTATPTAAYKLGPSADTAEVLTVLRYYTANGSRAYCDGAQPTAVDRQWLRLYVSAVGSSTRVARWQSALKAT